MKKVLIGYYSKTGTTSKVCEIINSVLEKAQYQVDLMELSQITNLTIYDIVIVAAPINGMQWVEPAKKFIMTNTDELRNKKFIAIYVSYIIRTGNKFWKNRIKKGIESLTKTTKPIVIKDFGGVVDKEFPTIIKKLFGIKKGTSLDVSDDNEVKTFTEELIKKLS